jgi:hypothetical protein
MALGADPRRNNDFTYANDPRGLQVPLGSHMRRMNPRDTEMAILADVNIHRIIRRSTTCGPPYDPNATPEQDDEAGRGIYFLFLSAKAMATMEFLQQEWINSGNFMGLDQERDPNVDLQEDGATFTIPQEPVRRRILWHPDIQRAARWRVPVHAQPAGPTVARRPRAAVSVRAPEAHPGDRWSPPQRKDTDVHHPLQSDHELDAPAIRRGPH